MFREVARKKQALPREECLQILTDARRGVLSVLGDNGYPYGMPLNHWYCPEEDRLYFHSGKLGHKMDALARCDRASYCVLDDGVREEGGWALIFRSVVAFGRVRMITDQETILDISRRLSLKFTQDLDYIEEEIRRSGPRTAMFALEIEHMTGKLVHEK